MSVHVAGATDNIGPITYGMRAVVLANVVDERQCSLSVTLNVLTVYIILFNFQNR